MIQSVASVPTANASRYLTALCKHFAHKTTVEYDGHRGRADFPFGMCRMEAGADALVLRCEAPDESTLERVENVVGVHLERFAWREKPMLAWTPVSCGEG